MTTRRFQFSVRILLASVLVVALVLAAATATRETTVNRSTYNKIEIGMFENEVDELFAQPSVDLVPLTFQDVVYDETTENLLVKYPPPHVQKSWLGGRYVISVHLDKYGRVASKYYKRTHHPTLLDRLADRLGI